MKCKNHSFPRQLYRSNSRTRTSIVIFSPSRFLLLLLIEVHVFYSLNVPQPSIIVSRSLRHDLAPKKSANFSPRYCVIQVNNEMVAHRRRRRTSKYKLRSYSISPVDGRTVDSASKKLHPVEELRSNASISPVDGHTVDIFSKKLHPVEDSEGKLDITTLSLALQTFPIWGGFIAFFGVLIASMISVSGSGGWRYFLAGGICACLSHTITTPIDVIKTRQQVEPGKKGGGLIETAVSMVKEEGMPVLLGGLGPTSFGYLFEGAMKFGVYELSKPLISRALSSLAMYSSISALNSRLLKLIICGVISGTVASCVLCPMEALRIRLVAEPEFAKAGWVQGGLFMLKNEGLLGMMKGMTAMLAKQVPYTITKQVSFDIITSQLYVNLALVGLTMGPSTLFAVPLISGMCASILSCISSQPGDLLLSLVNAHEGKKRTRDFSKNILKNNGICGFFLGMKARFLHVGLIVTLQLSIYDIVKRVVGIAATGT